MVPKSENLKSIIGEMLVSNAIFYLALLNTVLRAIHLNDQFLTELNEIDDVLADRGLAAKVKPISVEILQLHPELYLLWGHGFA